MIWATRTGSQTASMLREGSRSSRWESCWASVGSNSPETDRVSSPRSTCSGRSSSDPDSSRDRSSRSTESLRRRSTCSDTWSRNRRRVSGSRSSSSSSSTNPPSEKIGVRSSCEAVAMNFLRVCSSWRELALHLVEGDRQLAELVARVDRDRVVEVAGRDLLGGELEPLDPLAQRPGHEVAADQREQKRDPARHEDLVAHDGDAADDVRDRVGVDDHRADPSLVADGVGGLGDGAVAGHLDPGLALAGGRRLGRHWESQRRRRRQLARVGHRRELRSGGSARDQQQGHPVARGEPGAVDPAADLGRGHCGADRLDDPTRVPARAGGELRALLVQQAGLEARGRRTDTAPRSPPA